MAACRCLRLHPHTLKYTENQHKSYLDYHWQWPLHSCALMLPVPVCPATLLSSTLVAPVAQPVLTLSIYIH